MTGGMCGGGCAGYGACMVEGVHGGGMCGGGHAWQGACMMGGMCGEGHVWQGPQIPLQREGILVECQPSAFQFEMPRGGVPVQWEARASALYRGDLIP